MVAEVQEITQAGTGITLALSGHSVVGRLEKWQQRQRRVVPIKDLVPGTRFSMLDWVRVTGLSCTKGVWYIYDRDTGQLI